MLPELKACVSQGFDAVLKKYWVSKCFSDLEKVLNLAKMYKALKKCGNSKWKRNQEVSEQNFSEGKALHYLSSVMQCVKLSFLIKSSGNWREVVVLNFLIEVLKQYGNFFLKMCGLNRVSLNLCWRHNRKGATSLLLYVQIALPNLPNNPSLPSPIKRKDKQAKDVSGAAKSSPPLSRKILPNSPLPKSAGPNKEVGRFAEHVKIFFAWSC